MSWIPKIVGTPRCFGLCCLLALCAIGAGPARASGGPVSVIETPLPINAAASQAGAFDFARGSGGRVYGALGSSGTNGRYFGAVALDGVGTIPAPAFGEGGFTAPLKLPFGGFDNLGPQAEAIAIAPGGKLVVAGFSAEGVKEATEFSPLIACYRANGTLDPSFSGDGILGRAPQARGGTELHDVAVTDDGTILAAGGLDEESVGVAAPTGVLYAYRANGKADSAFGESGKVLFRGRHREDYSTLRGVQVLPSGKILVVGYLDSNLLLARLDTDGRLDRGFGGDGKVILDLRSNVCCEDAALGLASGGRIVVAAIGGSYPHDRVFLARYTATGKLDHGFGVKGVEERVHRRRLETLLGLAVQQNGKVVTVGRTEASRGSFVSSFAVFRNSANGTPDRGFGREGLYVLKPKTEGIANTALSLPGGTLVGGSLLGAEPANGGPPPTSLVLARFSG